jgi:hypothetical protein
VLRGAISEHAGTEVKNLGDRLMVAFGAASDAVACAVAIQQAVDRHNRRASEAVVMPVGALTERVPMAAELRDLAGRLKAILSGFMLDWPSASEKGDMERADSGLAICTRVAEESLSVRPLVPAVRARTGE